MIHIITSLTHNGRGRERHLSYFVKPPIQPASCLNSSMSATLAGRVNFAALLLCLVFVIVSHSHAPSAAFRLVLGSCVMRVPTRQSITYSAKDLCIVRSVDYPRLRLRHAGCRSLHHTTPPNPPKGRATRATLYHR